MIYHQLDLIEWYKDTTKPQMSSFRKVFLGPTSSTYDDFMTCGIPPLQWHHVNTMVSQITRSSTVYSSVCSEFCNTGSLRGQSTGDQWIPLTEDQYCGKRLHVITSNEKHKNPAGPSVKRLLNMLLHALFNRLSCLFSYHNHTYCLRTLRLAEAMALPDGRHDTSWRRRPLTFNQRNALSRFSREKYSRNARVISDFHKTAIFYGIRPNYVATGLFNKDSWTVMQM